MTKLSLELDDSAAATVRTVARQKRTTVEKLFVDFVNSLAEDDRKDTGESAATARLIQSFQTLSRPLGGKGYTSRDELHVR